MRWWNIHTHARLTSYFGTHEEAFEQMLAIGRAQGCARLKPATAEEAEQAYLAHCEGVRARDYEALRYPLNTLTPTDGSRTWRVVQSQSGYIKAMFCTLEELKPLCTRLLEADPHQEFICRLASAAEARQALRYLRENLGIQTVRIVTTPSAWPLAPTEVRVPLKLGVTLQTRERQPFIAHASNELFG
jgi:hypothetical protein